MQLSILLKIVTGILLTGTIAFSSYLFIENRKDKEALESSLSRIKTLEEELSNQKTLLEEQQSLSNNITTPLQQDKVDEPTKSDVSTVSNTVAEVSTACSKVTNYENSYKTQDGQGKSVSFAKGENDVRKYYELRDWIKSHYGDDDEDWMWKGGYKAVISNIEKDYQDYLKSKQICK